MRKCQEIADDSYRNGFEPEDTFALLAPSP